MHSRARLPLLVALNLLALGVPLAASPYSDAVNALGPVAYWRLGESSGTTAVDQTGTHNGTYVGPTLAQAGAISGDTDTSASFDGDDDYVNGGTFAVSGSGLTLMAWIRPDDFDYIHGTILAKKQPFQQNVLFVVASAGSLTSQDSIKKSLIESWGYSVTPISDGSSQASFDAAVATANAVYIAESTDTTVLGTKLKTAAIGIVSEEFRLSDEFQYATTQTTGVYYSSLTLVSTTHYLTSALSANPSTLFSSNQQVGYLTGTFASGLTVLGRWSTNSALAVVEQGGTLNDATTAAGRRVQLPWGDGAFDANTLTTDGQTLMRRAIEWAAGRGVLFVVRNAGSLTAQEALRRTLMESWGYRVTPITATSSQASYDAAAATHHVAFVCEEITSGDLNTKLKNNAIGVVNEEPALLDDFSIASGRVDQNQTTATISTNRHYITALYSPGALTLFTSSQADYYLSGTLAPGYVKLSEFGGNTSLVALERGAELYDGTFAAGRRVQLPWAGDTFDFNAANANAQAILRRALEWGALPEQNYWTLRTSPRNGGASLEFSVRTGGATSSLVANIGPLEVNKLIFVAAVYNGSTMKLYKDGVEIATAAKSGTLDGGSGVPIWIGDSPETTGGTNWRNPFDGRIDEAAIFNYAVNVADLLNLASYKKPDGIRVQKWKETR